MLAVGSSRSIATRDCPANDPSSMEQRSPYLGGASMPVVDTSTVHPASRKTAIMSSANCAASESPNFVKRTVDPRYSRRETTNLSWSAGAIRLCAKRACSSSKARSAIAARSCCLANSVSTLCCAALASAASFCRTATFPLSVFRSVRNFRLSFSSFWARSFAIAAALLASSMRALALDWMASWALFPDHHTRNIVNTVIASRITYPTNMRLWRLWAALIAPSSDDWLVGAAIAVFCVVVVVVAVLAIIVSNKRTAAIISRYCNTQKDLANHTFCITVNAVGRDTMANVLGGEKQITVLHIPPVTSAAAAVRAAIVQEFRSLESELET